MDTAEAHRLFDIEVERFRRVFPSVEGLKLCVVKRHFLDAPEARDLAWYQPDEHCIYLLRRALDLGKGTVLGLIRHECGHAVDDNLDAPGAEARADRLAKKATGQPIRYDWYDIQNAYVGRPKRPDYLPK